MTCRDCVHDNACRNMLRHMGYPCDGDGVDADTRCDDFEMRKTLCHDARTELPTDQDELNAVIFEGDIQRSTKGAAEALGASIWEGLRYYTIEKLEKSVRERDSQPQATERDKLARLIEAAMLTELTVETELKGADYVADYLLAHGVTYERREG